jgi:Family of unknown function (DUF6152)
MYLRTLTKSVTFLSVLFSWAALAHHSNAMYERDKVLEVTGTVREFQWTNPHTFIEMVVDGATGPQNYSVEGPTPGVLRASGWKFNSLKAGDKVVVKVHPLKDGRQGGGLISVSKDGVTLVAGGTSKYESGK